MQGLRRFQAIAGAMALAAFGAAGAGTAVAASGSHVAAAAHGDQTATATPIKHLVVIFDENVSFDHYFGTYPFAANLPGEQPFRAAPGTPTVNGLYDNVTPAGPTGPLLTSSPTRANPPRSVGHSPSLAQCLSGFSFNGPPESVPSGGASSPAVLDYYDGNTVTVLWNYAQHFSMGDNAYGTTYGPSTPGALNVTAAQTYGAICGPSSATINASPCAAPPGLNVSDPLSSTITTGPSGPTSVADQPAARPGTPLT